MTFVAPPLPVDPTAAVQPIVRGPVNLPPEPQSVAVLELPQALTDIERAILLSGTVIDQRTSPQGLVATVRTQLGDLLLQLMQPLPTGRPITIQLPPGHPPQTAIVEAGGTGTPAAPANPAQVAPPAVTPAVIASIGGQAAPLLPGMLLEILQLPRALLAQAVSGGQASAANPLLQDGETAPPNTAQPGATSTAPSSTPAQTAASPTTAPPATAALRGAGAALFAQVVATDPAAGAPPATTAPSITAPALPPSQTSAPLAVRVLQVLPPGTQVPAPTAPDQFTATVGTARVGGFPVATTADGQTIALQTNAGVEPGSVLVLQRLPAPVTRGEAPPLPLDPIQGKDWPALAQAVRALDIIDPAAAAALRASIPPPNMNLAPTLLFVAAALKLGDPRALFGAAPVDALKRGGKGALVERLFQDFEAASVRAADVPGAEWRSYPIPIREGDGQVAMMQLHLRRNDPHQVDEREANARDEGQGKHTRFVLDIAPSMLGPIQLDGLVRASMTAPLVDLVVRTKTPLPDQMRRDIAGIWAEALATTGAKGALSFQANPQGWVDTAGFRALGRGVGLSA
jgi:hypothetical protein